MRACELINTDLARLEELLNKNLRSEAMQYANIEPRIEDQVAQLNFPGRIDFEMMAAFQDLPVGSPLNGGDRKFAISLCRISIIGASIP